MSSDHLSPIASSARATGQSPCPYEPAMERR
jgi:hypothetical protein